MLDVELFLVVVYLVPLSCAVVPSAGFRGPELLVICCLQDFGAYRVVVICTSKCDFVRMVRRDHVLLLWIHGTTEIQYFEVLRTLCYPPNHNNFIFDRTRTRYPIEFYSWYTLTCPQSSHHELRTAAAVYLGVATVEPIAPFSILQRKQQLVVVIAVLSAMIVLAPHISYIVSGSDVFAIRSDPIKIGLFIGNRARWPISDRNRLSFRKH